MRVIDDGDSWIQISDQRIEIGVNEDDRRCVLRLDRRKLRELVRRVRPQERGRVADRHAGRACEERLDFFRAGRRPHHQLTKTRHDRNVLGIRRIGDRDVQNICGTRQLAKETTRAYLPPVARRLGRIGVEDDYARASIRFGRP